MWIFNTKAVKLKKERKKPKNKQKSRAQKAIRDAKSNFSCRMVNGWEAQQSPKPHRTTRENPFSLTKIVSGWKFQGCKKKKRKERKENSRDADFALISGKAFRLLARPIKERTFFVRWCAPRAWVQAQHSAEEGDQDSAVHWADRGLLGDFQLGGSGVPLLWWENPLSPPGLCLSI